MLQTIVRTPRTEDDIALGAQLAKMQNRPIGPAEVARVLRDAGVKYVIVGGHAANGYTGRPRATVDVDVIVQFPKKAADAMEKIFGRKTVYQFNLLLFGLATIIAALPPIPSIGFEPGLGWLLTFRFFAGVGSSPNALKARTSKVYLPAFRCL